MSGCRRSAGKSRSSDLLGYPRIRAYVAHVTFRCRPWEGCGKVRLLRHVTADAHRSAAVDEASPSGRIPWPIAAHPAPLPKVQLLAAAT
jgi:hypothetical protein